MKAEKRGGGVAWQQLGDCWGLTVDMERPEQKELESNYGELFMLQESLTGCYTAFTGF